MVSPRRVVLSTGLLALIIGFSFPCFAQQNQEELVVEKGIAEMQALMESRRTLRDPPRRSTAPGSSSARLMKRR